MKSKKIVKILRGIIIVLFLITVSILGVYPWKNQDVTINVETNKGQKSIDFSVNEISTLECFDMEYQGIKSEIIEEIWFNRQFKSVSVGKIKGTDVGKYATIEENKIVFNQKMSEKLFSLSHSFLMERIIYAEIALAVTMGLWILVNAIGERLDNRDNHGPVFEIKKFVRDMVNYHEYMFFAARADLKAEVANSYLNRLWWILEPFCNMLVYVIVFGHVMGNSIENYATFVFSALLMWNFFHRVVEYSVKCVRNNRDIVTKIYVPKYVLLITNMILSFIKLLFSLLVLIVMLMIFKVQIGWGVLWIIPAYLVMLVVAFGVGMILLHYGVYVDDLGYAVGILLQMLMFLSGLFYDMNITLPNPLNGILVCINPVAMFIDTMRNALLNNMVRNVPLIVLWLILAILLSYMGIHIVNKSENGYVKVI